ncbi:hypothetical protein C0992_012728 [Termitomyces sp. T32_za158]|nr:hypothetical protein C0992_012728 [Termitomyces sp. T32_za158]
MNAFRSAAISFLRRPHTRSLSSKSTSAPLHKKSKTVIAQAAKTSSEAGKALKGVPLRDFAIPHRFVRLVDPETGRLHDPQPLKSILSTIDSRSHYLELVTDIPEPIVKIFNRYVEKTRAAEAAYKAREVVRQNVHKEVQLSWSSAPADLAHKINKVREDLLRGARVDLVFARKSKQHRLEPAVMHERASEAIASLQDVSKEWKEREIRLPQGLLVVYLEGTETAEVAADTDVTNSHPEPSGKRFVVSIHDTLTDLNNVARRMQKDLAKGIRVELIVSAKVPEQTEGQQNKPPTADELHAPAAKLIKMLGGEGEVNEWSGRHYKTGTHQSQISAKLIMYLEKQGSAHRGKFTVHKGPKPKKMKPSDIPDLYQQD